ncbi:hypothetical protein [Streptomyces celluloflavus]|uniref:hypothetical protein n=1 Tax=Streptomyces celluloflavus TaxID=58344 RepID=UPI0036C8D82C
MSWKNTATTDTAATGTTTARSSLRRGRRIAAASLIAVAALSLTACQNDRDGVKASPDASSPGTPGQAPSDGAPATPAKNGSDGGGKSPESGQSHGSGAGATGGGSGARHSGASGSGAGAGSSNGGGSTNGGGSASRGKGVVGTWEGILNYLAPGKLTVTPSSGPEQAFFIGPQTKTLGAAGICASNGNVTVDSHGYGTSPCTEAQLEKASKMDAIRVRVTVRDGLATEIAERYHP